MIYKQESCHGHCMLFVCLFLFVCCLFVCLLACLFVCLSFWMSWGFENCLTRAPHPMYEWMKNKIDNGREWATSIKRSHDLIKHHDGKNEVQKWKELNIRLSFQQQHHLDMETGIYFGIHMYIAFLSLIVAWTKFVLGSNF